VATVQSGPFQGLRYSPGSEVWCNEIPKLLGTYEAELQAVLSSLLAARPAVVVDVGGGEGYFALGLGRAVGASRLLVVEGRAALRRACARLAEANDLSSRVQLLAQWNPAAVAALDFSRGAVVRWNEPGCEAELLDPALSAHLARAHLIVECQDLPVNPRLEQLRRGFQATHDCRIIRELPNARRIAERESNLVHAADPFEREIAFAEVRMMPVLWVVLSPRQQK
jgi:hypothetical protein